MANMQPLLGKRKRAQISYAEDNDELDQLLFDDSQDAVLDGENTDEEDDDDVPTIDDDAEYGKKASKKAIAAKRQAKRVKRAEASKQKLCAKPFPFLRLPLELRYMIYDYALTDHSVRMCTKTRSYRRSVRRDHDDTRPRYRHDSVTGEKVWGETPHIPPNHFAPSLLAVNKQIHDEGAAFLYGQRFEFADLYALHSFLANIGTRNCSRLSDLTVEAWGYGRGVHRAMNFCAFAMLTPCTNLTKLTLNARVGWGNKPILVARNVYRNAHHFMEAYGAAKGRKDAALDVIVLSEENFQAWRDGRVISDEQLKQEYCAELRKLLGA